MFHFTGHVLIPSPHFVLYQSDKPLYCCTWSQVKLSCISPLKSHIDLELESQTLSLSLSLVATGAKSYWKTHGLWEALWSGMCLTGWAWKPVVDTLKELITLQKYTTVRVHRKQIQRERQWQEEIGKVTASTRREELDSVPLLSRVFDGQTLTFWMTHKRSHNDYSPSWLSHEA